MTLLVVAIVWMFLLWLAAGLCAAARLGDRTRVIAQAESTVTRPATHRLAA